MNLFSNGLFLFCSQRRARIKALLWEGDGFILLYKRLKRRNFQWPKLGGHPKYYAVATADKRVVESELGEVQKYYRNELTETVPVSPLDALEGNNACLLPQTT
ncbi:IS66 family insertion sequence element accessory protein TnpB [Pelosinus sp. UFO1]|uniref:IS66 family insertion sequence element accessory protein TnpB n=1 Tax=Pelosinus sp. UFO1 TaxID=484770 RepID=UPI000A04835D